MNQNFPMYKPNVDLAICSLPDSNPLKKLLNSQAQHIDLLEKIIKDKNYEIFSLQKIIRDLKDGYV